tara:strand:- start:294 stop:686 length:393 start_codon:yes stop_codon:yes gene_type:complete
MATFPFVGRGLKPSIDILGNEIPNAPFDWFTTAEQAGTPQSRIYRAFGEKNISPSNTYSYKNRMTEDQFYDFVKIRGNWIQDKLLANNMRWLKALEDRNEEKAKKLLSRISRKANDYAKRKVGYDPDSTK